MASSTGPETKALRSLVDSLPPKVADWTPDQRQDFNTQSDKSMREQNSTQQPNQLT